MTKTHSHDVRLDLLRTVAILGTIAIHSVHEIFARYDYAGGGTWWLANALNSAAKVSIPFFILLSGALLFERLDTVEEALARVGRRLLVPLAFWVLLYRLVDFIWFDKPFDVIGLYHLALNGNLFIFYFLVILAGAYVVTPFFKWYAQAHGEAVFLRRSMWALLAIGGVYTASSYVLNVEHSWWNSTTMWLPYYGYFIAGHLIYRKNWLANLASWRLIALVVGSFVGLLLANYANMILASKGIFTLWHAQGFGVQYIDEYLNPLSIALSLSLFALVMRWQPTNGVAQPWYIRALAHASSMSFGMYAIHSFVLQVLEHGFLMTTGAMQQQLLTLLLGKLLITVGVSWVISTIVSRVPYLNVLTGVSRQSG